ncbi:membrane protein [Agaricicola taiwanensis]|uniref:Membrane protein n=1 Tax=Agaricicola taiwanensis TaxID=591372 RepID=A0A8J3DWF8_9RHOB|nr:DUF599 domain-containing protein [Agaricicola taiwanensis]GGE46575.1 membrane protein [Agaricicola taiwanensis]
MQDFSLLDFVAVGVFLGAWALYYVVIELSPFGNRTLNRIMDQYRAAWMMRMIVRENRIVDTTIMSSLQNGAAFFASTSLLAIGGGLAALGATDTALDVFAAVPYAPPTTRIAFEAKILGLVAIFIYGFFKFAWSFRLFNYSAILVGAVPLPSQAQDPATIEAANKAGRMNISAGRHFNRGLRALFFALAYLGWLAGPWGLMITTVGVLIVLFRRQFVSDSLVALGD